MKLAAPIPLIAAFLMGLSYVIDISFGSFRGILLTITWVSCGVLYVSYFFKNSGRPDLQNAAIHGAILATVASLIFEIVFWIAGSVQSDNWGISIMGIVFYVIQSAMIGALGAMAGFAYMTEKTGSTIV